MSIDNIKTTKKTISKKLKKSAKLKKIQYNKKIQEQLDILKKLCSQL